MNKIMLILIIAAMLTACVGSGDEAQKTIKDAEIGWLPEEYQPIDSELLMLNDTAVQLLTQLHYDVNLNPEEYVAVQERARKLLETVIRKDPKYGLPYSNLAALYLDRKDTLKALEMMELRVKVDPDLAEGWQILGFYKDLMGDSTEAYKAYKVALSKFEDRLALGKRYERREDVAYYYDNWAGKAYTMLLMGQTEAGHGEIRALLEEVAPLMGKDAEVYALLLEEDRNSLLNPVQGEAATKEEDATGLETEERVVDPSSPKGQ